VGSVPLQPLSVLETTLTRKGYNVKAGFAKKSAGRFQQSGAFLIYAFSFFVVAPHPYDFDNALVDYAAFVFQTFGIRQYVINKTVLLVYTA